MAFKAKGQWIMSFDYGDGGNFLTKTRNGDKKTRTTGYGNKSDQFNAMQRVRLQLDAVASESLSGTVFFEIGNQTWGNANTGGALGADGIQVEVKRAYIDWIVPNTDLKVRMGLQGLALPAFPTGGSMVLGDDVAGIVLSNKFNDNVTLTAFWARPFNDNYNKLTYTDNFGTEHSVAANYMDNMDMFGLLLPLSFDGFKVTPWAMVGGIGPNVLNNSVAQAKYRNSNGVDGYMGESWKKFAAGMLPAVSATRDGRTGRLTEYGTAFWAGLTGEVTMWDPFRLAWDVNYGGVDYGKQQYNRSGWYATLLAEYKMDWATPGIYGWYSSGDDGNVKNGSERMPIISATGDNGYSTYALNGNPWIGSREGAIGNTPIGTWGIGARLKDMSFLEGLKHTLRVNYFGGTNSPSMAKYITGKKDVAMAMQDRKLSGSSATAAGFNSQENLYLTTQDSAVEFGLYNEYKVYENLTLAVDAAYIALWLDQSRSVWGGATPNFYGPAVRGISTTDAWNVNVSFVYDF